MMKTITWKVIMDDNNQIASLEQAQGFSQDSVESNLIIIGILENLKQKHQEKLKTLFSKTIKKKANGEKIEEIKSDKLDKLDKELDLDDLGDGC